MEFNESVTLAISGVRFEEMEIPYSQYTFTYNWTIIFKTTIAQRQTQETEWVR